MYSRFNDGQKPPEPRLPAHLPSYRQRVRVPPGYRGLAVVEGSETLPANKDFGYAGASESHVEGLERLALAQGAEVLGDRERAGEGERAEVVASSLPAEGSSPSAAPPPARREGCLLDLSHFPFGHGLGTEEWLLIGLILLLLREAGPDRGDLDETVILLGLLLLGG